MEQKVFLFFYKMFLLINLFASLRALAPNKVLLNFIVKKLITTINLYSAVCIDLYGIKDICKTMPFIYFKIIYFLYVNG
jgi:hypothetical protein